MTVRDTQRQRLYDAERSLGRVRASELAQRYLIDTEISESWTVVRDGVRVYLPYPSVASVRSYVDAVRGSAKFQRRWGYRHLQVTSCNGRSSCYGNYLLRLAVKDRHDLGILHEVAHALVPDRYADHGPEFAATMLTLVDLFCGKATAGQLRAAYAARRVKYRAGLAFVPKPDAVRLARARSHGTIKVAPPTGRPALDPVPVAVRKRAAVEGYDASYAKGYAFHGQDMDLGLSNFQTRHPRGNADGWQDGWLDMMAGREKWHMRECIAGRVECDEHTWSPGYAARMGIAA